MFDIQKEIKEI